MSASQIICFGQQPSGIIPHHFLLSKIKTTRNLQAEIGGEIVFFYHDSDHDYRETITNIKTPSGIIPVNFTQENKLQKKYSPLAHKRIPEGWKEKTLRQLEGNLSEEVTYTEEGNLSQRNIDFLNIPFFKKANILEVFKQNTAGNVADFCLEMYTNLGLLEGIKIVRSSDPIIRSKAIDLDGEYFVDVEYEQEIVRAKYTDGKLLLHKGGGKFIELPVDDMVNNKKAISPTRDNRLPWMQSVVQCTHYVMGKGEKNYMDLTSISGVKFVERIDCFS